MATTNTDIQRFLNRVKKMEKGEKLDLSSDEDLSVAVMNLISMEEHFFFTFSKTHDAVYLDLLTEVRTMRKELLKRLIKEYEGEVWCISKHLLATSMRLMEVGTKFLSKGEQKEAADFFQKSYQMYSLFWGLNLGLVKAKDVPASRSLDKQRTAAATPSTDRSGARSSRLFDTLGEVVKKAIDCCLE